MLLVGQNRFARYADAVSAEIRELNLANVHVVGAVDDARLAAMFRRATAFVTVSEHEGFCVPLLEAMAFDVPVLARACAAIPETVGDGGVAPARVGRRRARRRGDRPHRARRRTSAASSSRAAGSRLRELTEVDARVADARSPRRGRLMRLLYVVQRYGEQIAGGAEQHAASSPSGSSNATTR